MCICIMDSLNHGALRFKAWPHAHVSMQPDAPRRASLREGGVSSDWHSIDVENRNGEVVIINGERIRMKPAIDTEPTQRERHPPGCYLVHSPSTNVVQPRRLLAFAGLDGRVTMGRDVLQVR